MNVGTLVPSVVRTVTPIVVGALLTLLIAIGVELPEDMETELLAAVGLLITAVVQTVYYVVVRLLERKWPQIGVLLGLPKTPDSYSADTAPQLNTDEARQAPYLSDYKQLNDDYEPVTAVKDTSPPTGAVSTVHLQKTTAAELSFPPRDKPEERQN